MDESTSNTQTSTTRLQWSTCMIPCHQWVQSAYAKVIWWNPSSAIVRWQYGLAGGELGHSLCSFRDSVLWELSRKNQTDRSLNLARRNGWLFVVAGQIGGFVRNLVEDIIDERVHDGHGLGGNSSVWVNLFQHLVDINLVRFRLRQQKKQLHPVAGAIGERKWGSQRILGVTRVVNNSKPQSRLRHKQPTMPSNDT